MSRRTSSASSRSRCRPPTTPGPPPAPPAPATGSSRPTTSSTSSSTTRHRRIVGRETITYTNQAPDTLRYLWLQLDPNLFRPDSDAVTDGHGPALDDRVSFGRSSGCWPAAASTAASTSAPSRPPAASRCDYTINKTMMRVELPEPAGDRRAVRLQRRLGLRDQRLQRSSAAGPASSTSRMTATASTRSPSGSPGWPPTPTPPAGSTSSSSAAASSPSSSATTSCGSPSPTTTSSPPPACCRTPRTCSKPEWRERLEAGRDGRVSRSSSSPPRRRRRTRSRKPEGKKTWIFQAENVRDFAFARSRKFIWDAQRHDVERQPGDGDVVLPERGGAALEQVLDRRDHPHAERLLALHLRLSRTRWRSVDQRAGRRDGIPDDLLQRPAARGGRHLLASAPSTA